MRRASQSPSAHSCSGRKTTEAFLGGTSVRERVRVDLEQEPAVLGADLVLVVRARLELGDEQLPDPRRAERAHRVQPAVPAVEVADDADRARRRRPDREGDALRRRRVRRRARRAGRRAPRGGPRREVEVELAERRAGSGTGRRGRTSSRPGSRSRAGSGAAARRRGRCPRTRLRGECGRARRARRPRGRRGRRSRRAGRRGRRRRRPPECAPSTWCGFGWSRWTMQLELALDADCA